MQKAEVLEGRAFPDRNASNTAPNGLLQKIPRFCLLRGFAGRVLVHQFG
jgi:hypothetical protein